MKILTLVAVSAALLLAACAQDEDVGPAPVAFEVTEDAVGHYCGMLLKDHQGPKGQIHLAGQKEPVWFSSVRDTLAFTHLPEEPDDITAIYVNDMGRATWASPEPGTWIEARQAWFVIDSTRKGGMGAPEAIPFGEERLAAAFAAEHGGRVVRFDDVPEAYVLGPTEVGSPDMPVESGHSNPAMHGG